MEEPDNRKSAENCDGPYRPPASLVGIQDDLSLSQADLRKSLRADERRSLAWFVVMMVTFLFSSVIRIGAVGSTAWNTWMINWQSNLIFYFSMLSLVIAARFGLRSASTLRKLKSMEDWRTDGRD